MQYLILNNSNNDAVHVRTHFSTFDSFIPWWNDEHSILIALSLTHTHTHGAGVHPYGKKYTHMLMRTQLCSMV